MAKRQRRTYSDGFISSGWWFKVGSIVHTRILFIFWYSLLISIRIIE